MGKFLTRFSHTGTLLIRMVLVRYFPSDNESSLCRTKSIHGAGNVECWPLLACRSGSATSDPSHQWGECDPGWHTCTALCGRAVFLPIGRHQLTQALIFNVSFSRQLGGFAWYLSCSIDPSRGRRHDHLDGRTQTRQTWLHRPALLPTAILYCLPEEFTE